MNKTGKMPSEILRSWTALNEALQILDEKQLVALLSIERKGKRRPTVLLRIHQRYAKVRLTREREELRRLAA